MTTAYESWVGGLRRWQDDPATDLTNLPELTSVSLPPSAFERLFAHLNKSLATMSENAWRQFSRGFQSARDDHERTAALVALRAALGRRLQLAQNPRLPVEIRDALRHAAERDINKAQHDLEAAAVRPMTGGGSDRDGSEAMLRILRVNSLTAILAAGFDIESLYRGGPAGEMVSRNVLSDDSHLPRPVVAPRPARRRVLAED